MTRFFKMISSKETYYNMLPDFIISVVGSVVGIVLTVGVTYCSEKKDKEEMARKVVMLTIHNLDVSISGMERLVDDLSRQDSVFRYVRDRKSLSVSVSPDTVGLFVSALYSHRIRPKDSSTEAVFSTNFEIWKYIDDPKIIGRIANCYSLMDECEEEYERVEKDKYEIFLSVYDSRSVSSPVSDSELADRLLSQPGLLRVMDALPYEIRLMRNLIKNAKALNNRNKAELHVSQEELDEIGRLL